MASRVTADCSVSELDGVERRLRRGNYAGSGLERQEDSTESRMNEDADE